MIPLYCSFGLRAPCARFYLEGSCPTYAVPHIDHVKLTIPNVPCHQYAYVVPCNGMYILQIRATRIVDPSSEWSPEIAITTTLPPRQSAHAPCPLAEYRAISLHLRTVLSRPQTDLKSYYYWSRIDQISWIVSSRFSPTNTRASSLAILSMYSKKQRHVSHPPLARKCTRRLNRALGSV